MLFSLFNATIRSDWNVLMNCILISVAALVFLGSMVLLFSEIFCKRRQPAPVSEVTPPEEPVVEPESEGPAPLPETPVEEEAVSEEKSGGEEVSVAEGAVLVDDEKNGECGTMISEEKTTDEEGDSVSASGEKQDPDEAKNEPAKKHPDYVNPILAWCLLGGTLALAIIIGLIVLL